MNFRAYLDESYDLQGRKLYVFAGYYGDSKSWNQFEVAWQLILSKYGMSNYHSKELVEVATRCNVEIWRLAEDFRKVISDAEGIYPSVCMLDFRKYSELLPRFTRARQIPASRGISGSLGDPWFLAFQFILERVVQDARGNEILCGGDVIDFVFDQQEQFQGRAVLLADDVRSEPKFDFARWIGRVSFASREDAIPLQAADLLANETLREVTPWSTGRARWATVSKRIKGIHKIPDSMIPEVLDLFESRAREAILESGDSGSGRTDGENDDGVGEDGQGYGSSKK